MKEDKFRPLHLHTLDSLCSDLISKRPIGVGKDSTPFVLKSDAARSILNWYYSHKNKWAGNVMAGDIEAIVECISTPPQNIPEKTPVSLQTPKHYTLISVQAHQFAGLHHAGSTKNRPDDFCFTFAPEVTMFEGFNGCGKTSLLNAIIWTLTGEVLRPQRPPEPGDKEFTCEIDGTSKHTLSPVMPLPDPAVEKPDVQALPADNWVELIFEDENKAKYVVKRSLKRNRNNVLQDTVSGLDTLNLDPVGNKVGTTMPGQLAFIQVGTESKLGKAVAELTGMAPLVNLSSHAERAKNRINGDMQKQRMQEIAEIDAAYNRSRTDLLENFKAHPTIAFTRTIPEPSNDSAIEATLEETMEYFEGLQTKGLTDATLVLGNTFDPDNTTERTNLENSIQPAIVALGDIEKLPSMGRLNSLKALSEEQIREAQDRIKGITEEAGTLVEIAADPNKAGRIRLYTRVAAWIKEHTAIAGNDEICAVCGHDLKDSIDPITGISVKTHLKNAATADNDFLGQTFMAWSRHVQAELSHSLPPALAHEMKTDLPDHPSQLIRTALINELFENNAFQNTLRLLSPNFQVVCDQAISTFPEIKIDPIQRLSNKHTELESLNIALTRINKAIAFSIWKNQNQACLKIFMEQVVGQAVSDKGIVQTSLLGRLTRLKMMIKAIEPINHAMTLCERMNDDIAKRRTKEKKLAAYAVASEALTECMKVGAFAEKQVEVLQHKLHTKAVEWRNRIYSSAFPSTSLDLIATKMSGDGELQLMVGATGLAAPAQHVSNASALRASLVGFFLAYWEYMLVERGGLKLLLLDDPQELLDGDNREKLADSVKELTEIGAQLIITTHDGRFATSVAKRAQSTNIGINHLYIHPATCQRGTIYPSPSISKVQDAHNKFIKNQDDVAAAQEYASECRVFIEGRIGDIFDDTTFPSATTLELAPTLSDHLNRLRSLVNNGSNELFRSPILKKFCNDHALQVGSTVLSLLNKAHHSSKTTIRPMDVLSVVKDLERLRRSIESVHEEFRLFRRRENLTAPVTQIPSLNPCQIPQTFKVFIQPSLAAFVRYTAVGDSQETEFDEISSEWFNEKAFFLLRSNNLGFVGTASSVAIVETEPSSVEDRCLVIARRGNDVYARRALRPPESHMVGLTAETPDPRKSPPTLIMHEDEVALHRIVGMLFCFNGQAPTSKAEAIQIANINQLVAVQSAYKIKEDSAIPLALPGQIALGGSPILMSDFNNYSDAYVALHLDDGSSIFKRVGDALPQPLSHLRRFETIGGLGVSDILSIGKTQAGFRKIEKAVPILGIIYNLFPTSH
ncbi:MAG: AAA family ATPase [Azovibrio sp.]